ncbi:AaceriAEL225Cp [[Ashbya] aceris (nom. inval.)]|nr:AaceriAEL225Cp [[Ashbya] aceris (nom. inval.)]
MTDTFAEATEKFVEWLQEVGIEVAPEVKVEDLRDEGQNRSVVASGAVQEGATLFTIPRSALLNVHTSTFRDCAEGLPSALEESIGHWEGLVMCVYYERCVLREKSRWWPCLRLFPAVEDMDNLVYWSAEQRQLLTPSLVVSRIGDESAREMYARVLALADEWGLAELRDMSWDAFVHIASVIMAYSFDCRLSSDDDDEEDEDDALDGGTVAADGCIKSMVALAETLNSDTHLANANLTYDRDLLKMVAVKDIEAGEQVYNLYGSYSNAELLRRYGYVEWTGSKYDYGEIELSAIRETISKELAVPDFPFDAVLALLEDKDGWAGELFDYNDVVEESYDCYADGELAPDGAFLVQLLVALAQVPRAALGKGSALSVRTRKISKKVMQLLESGRITRKAADVLESVIRERIQAYPPHAAVFDGQKPADLQTMDSASRREAMARCVLQCEVKALQKCELAISSNYKIISDDLLMGKLLN